jgi:hypothetical protein
VGRWKDAPAPTFIGDVTLQKLYDPLSSWVIS